MRMDTKLIFVGGIHGVGKSTFCKKLQAQHDGLELFSASSLITHYKSNAFTSSKKVGQIEDNQDVLVKAFNLQKKSKKLVLLDGHFCLFDNQYSPQRISQRIFEQLNVELFILLTAPLDIVFERMEQRDEKVYPFKKIP